MNNGRMRSSMATGTDKKIVTLDNLQTFLSKTDERYLSQLSNYVKTTDMNTALATKVDAEPGKMLSQNDFTDQLLAKLQGVDEGANRITIATTLGESDAAAISQKAVADALATKADRTDLQSLATTNYVDQKLEQKASLAGNNSFEGKNTFSYLYVQDVYYGQNEESLLTNLDGKADKTNAAQSITTGTITANTYYYGGDTKTPLVLDTTEGRSTTQTVSQGAIKTILDTKIDSLTLQNQLSSYAKKNDAKQDITAYTIEASSLTAQQYNYGQGERNLVDDVEALQKDKADKSQLSSYVTLNSEQTITGSKTFTGAHEFTGETQFTNVTYAPTFTDIAASIGKSSSFTRGAFMQAFVGQMIAPNKDCADADHGYAIESGKIKFQRVTGTNNGQPMLADLAVLSEDSLSVSGEIKTSFKNSVAMGSYQANAITIASLVDEVRYSSGCAGSINLKESYTKDNLTIVTG